MRRGLFVAPFDELADPERLMTLAATAESAGWDGVFLWDHLTYPGSVREIADPYVALAAVASATTTIQLGPLVTPLTRRRLTVVARAVATLQVLARGRLVLGVGLGDDEERGEHYHRDQFLNGPARARALDESLVVLRELLTRDEVDHDGPDYRVRGASFRPRGARYVPTWVAARWPHGAPLRRAARYDGVVAINLEEPSDVVEMRERLRVAGADLATFEVVVDPSGAKVCDARSWEEAGVTYLLHREGPFELNYGEVMERIEMGPGR